MNCGCEDAYEVYQERDIPEWHASLHPCTGKKDMYNPYSTAGKLMKLFYDVYGVPEHNEIQPIKEPGHGSCCTCQKCGYYYGDGMSECVCSNNEFWEKYNELFKD
jgi:hypothetical protein